MDVDLLEELQVSGARIRLGGHVGLIDGFRTGRDGWVRLRDRDTGELVEVAAGDFEAVDPVDPVRVDAMRTRKEQEARGFGIARTLRVVR